MDTDNALTVGFVGEHALIARLRSRITHHPEHVVIGPGDDAAVIEPVRGQLDVITTDCLVEDVHFRRHWTSPRDLGHKALAINLSDIGAMGASPRASWLSLALPAHLPIADFDGIIDGFVSLADASGAPLAGGNVAASPSHLMLDVTVMGAAHRRRLLRRDTARAGHELFVSGSIGAAAAGLQMLRADAADTADDAQRACLDRYHRPETRYRLGNHVGRSGTAAACIDLSDGLADAVRQLAEASGTGATVHAGLVPVDEGARSWADRQGLDPIGMALTGGEDYELLFAVHPRQRRRLLSAARHHRNLALTRIGVLTAAPGVWLEQEGRQSPLPGGFAHFAD